MPDPPSSHAQQGAVGFSRYFLSLLCERLSLAGDKENPLECEVSHPTRDEYDAALGERERG